MSWVRIDDRAPEHRKQLAAGPAACWLWVCGLSYANRQSQHDGFIPHAALGLLGCGARAHKDAARLVEVGLWEAADGGWYIHDYDHYQMSKEQVLDRAARGRAGGIQSGVSRRSKLEAEPEAVASSKREANGKQTFKQTGSKREAKTNQTRTIPSPSPDPRKAQITATADTRSSARETPEPPNGATQDPGPAAEVLDLPQPESESGTGLLPDPLRAVSLPSITQRDPPRSNPEVDARRAKGIRDLQFFDPTPKAKP